MRVRLTPGQVEWVLVTAERSNLSFDHGKTWIEAERQTLDCILFELRFALDDDHAMNVAGNSNRDLTDAQVAFGVRQIFRCLRGAIETIDRQLRIREFRSC